MTKGTAYIIGALVGVALVGCSGEKWPEGLRKTPEGMGAVVMWDLNVRPFPDIPFPNDVATRLDPSSPTGRRLNVSMVAATKLEEGVRRKINTLTGFGIYGPMSVSFSSSLDLANIIKRQRDNDDVMDDAVLVINMNPRSPRFGSAVTLDLGEGNFPLTLENRGNYFENDPLFTSSTIVFDDSNTFNESDPNQPGSNPDTDMLTFYERKTNTLILRALLPMEEESLYAVVLTRRLVDMAGQPVRSPFPYINHVSQTESLRPLIGILPRYGLTIDDVAFVWDFTTQGATRDLVTIRKGLYGKGPMSWLSGEFPASLTDVLPLNTFTDSSHYILNPGSLLNQIEPFVNSLLGDVPTQDVQALIAPYNNVVDYFIAGEYTTPYFLVDKDGLAAEGFPDDENESFDIDPVSGRAVVRGAKIAFFCTIPKSGPWGTPPFPVVVYMHGSGNFKIESLGFAGNLAKFGVATCAIDAVGHGLCLDPGMEELARALFASVGTEPVFDLMSPGRARDLNNDGICESGGDFWTADIFHTRDVVRQTAVDEVQLIRVLRQFDGKTRWAFDINVDGTRDLAGDFNADGVPDIGGPYTDYFAFGTSLGGIQTAVLAGVEPAITAAATNSGGGGLIDITSRSVQGGAVEAIFLRTMGPFLVGTPLGGGVTELKFLVPNVDKLAELPFATVAGTAITEGDRIILTNLRSGAVDEVTASGSSCYDPTDAGNPTGRASLGPCFRISFAADGTRAGIVRKKLGITRADTQDPQFIDYGKPIANPLEFGDPLSVVIRDGVTGNIKRTISTFEMDVHFQSGRFVSGTTLVAPFEGFGLWRSTPDLRRMMGISAIITEPADPIAYAPHYHLDPFDYLDVDPGLEMGANVLDVVTVGDMNVPVSTGVALARAAGMIPLSIKDPRSFTITTTGQRFSPYTRSVNEILRDTYVIEGLERLGRYTDTSGGLLLDIDNLSMGHDFTTTNARQVPRLDPPLRVTVPTKTGVAGMRIPYVNPTGRHAVDIPHPLEDFDMNMYMVNVIGRYFQSRGKEILDDPCLETEHFTPCTFLPTSP